MSSADVELVVISQLIHMTFRLRSWSLRKLQLSFRNAQDYRLIPERTSRPLARSSLTRSLSACVAWPMPALVFKASSSSTPSVVALGLAFAVHDVNLKSDPS